MSEAQTQRKAYSYLRFSCAEQANGDSFRRQSSLATKYADMNNLDLDDSLTFHDLGVSAYHGLNAETGRLGALLEAVRIGLIPCGSVILVESLDRISRQSARRALRVIENIVETGVSVVTLSDGREYTAENLDNDPISLLMALLIFIRANEESAVKSRRIAAAWIMKRERAKEKPLTSRLPGWIRLSSDRKQLEIIPEQAEIVRRIFREALNGRGVLLIMRQLNLERAPQSGAGGRKGEMWYTGSISRLLKNPAVIGTMTPRLTVFEGGKIRYKPCAPISNYFPAVISDEDFYRLQGMRNPVISEATRGYAKAPVYNLLAGLGRCCYCESRISLVSRSKKGSYLVCAKGYSRAGCLPLSVRYIEVETAILRNLQNTIGTASLPKSETILKRIREIGLLLSARSIDRPAINSALRSLIESIIVSPRAGTLQFTWRYGGSSTIESAFTPYALRNTRRLLVTQHKFSQTSQRDTSSFPPIRYRDPRAD